MNNIETMTSEQIRVEIAKQLGYTVRYYEEHDFYVLLWPSGNTVSDKNGKPVRETCLSEAAAWRNTPDWMYDVNVAIRLIDAENDHLEIWNVGRIAPPGEGWRCRLKPHNDHRSYNGAADDPALAICFAWLAWKGEQK
jgi:hypothetical protein